MMYHLHGEKKIVNLRVTRVTVLVLSEVGEVKTIYKDRHNLWSLKETFYSKDIGIKSCLSR